MPLRHDLKFDFLIADTLVVRALTLTYRATRLFRFALMVILFRFQHDIKGVHDTLPI